MTTTRSATSTGSDTATRSATNTESATTAQSATTTGPAPITRSSKIPGSAAPVTRSAPDRLLAVLAAFDHAHTALSLSDISRRAGLTLTTAHRLRAPSPSGERWSGTRRGRTT